ncbi:hypothetical protein PG993_012441 [Apiospora rasikravindrae]|uniref:Uncharacterized protein n=1 Tax=Apiospora rasikravindrae TaxID=990691 RepID=A0ABR1S2F9_9PEZI
MPIFYLGTPPTRQYGSTSLPTTALAATVEPRPTRTPGKTKARAPIQLSFSVRIGRAKDVPLASRLNSGSSALQMGQMYK